MSPADEVTSLTAIGGNAYHAPAAFTTTHWSVVLEAQGESPAAQEALEKLCRVYWRPIYCFVRRQGVGPAEAEDITQGFFAQLLERRSFDAVRKEKGRLRSYLLGALKYFLADEQRHVMAIKRGKGQRLISLDELRADKRIDMEPADPVTAEMIYERRWALTVLERVLSRLKDEYRVAGNTALFDALKELLPDEPGAPSQAEIAARLGMNENAIRQAFYRFRQRYQSRFSGAAATRSGLGSNPQRSSFPKNSARKSSNSFTRLRRGFHLRQGSDVTRSAWQATDCPPTREAMARQARITQIQKGRESRGCRTRRVESGMQL